MSFIRRTFPGWAFCSTRDEIAERCKPSGGAAKQISHVTGRGPEGSRPAATKVIFLAGWALLFLLASGCQDARFAPVQGQVTLDGQPLPRGMVQFVPMQTDGNAAVTAVGTIGADGSYTLQSDQTPGALVGRHKVRLEARAVPRDETDTLPASLIPPRYETESTSGLDVEVVAGKLNVIDLPLKSE